MFYIRDMQIMDVTDIYLTATKGIIKWSPGLVALLYVSIDIGCIVAIAKDLKAFVCITANDQT